MNSMRTQQLKRATALVAVLALVTVGSAQLRADTQTTGNCGVLGTPVTIPFTDVAGNNIFFCAIAEAYFTGLTNGTTATTYSPATDVTREQMAAFITRTLDQSLRRGSRRAAAQQWWQPSIPAALHSTDLGSSTQPFEIAWDGADLWVANTMSGTVSRVRASDGKLLETWTGATNVREVLVAAGRVFVAGNTNLYVIDPTQVPGAVTLFANNLPVALEGLTFDGTFLWTASGFPGSISRIPVFGGAPTTYTDGFEVPADILWDGENLWVADDGTNEVKRVSAGGAVLEAIPVGNQPHKLLFDGANLWVSNKAGSSVTVIRAVGGLRGTVLATLTGNGLNGPTGLAFDGERVLVVNNNGNSVSLFKAADLTPLGSLSVGLGTFALDACSDGLNFWITRANTGDIVRF